MQVCRLQGSGTIGSLPGDEPVSYTHLDVYKRQTSLTVAREWEMGTMEQLLSTPVRAGEIVLGKMLAFFVVGAADTTIAVLVGIFVYGVPFRGNVLMLAASTAVFLSGAFFWGIFVSAIARTQLFAFQLGLVTTFLPSFLLSGFLYAIENMPLPIQMITYAFPARYFVTIVRGIFLKGIGLSILWGQLAFLAVFSIPVSYTHLIREPMRKMPAIKEHGRPQKTMVCPTAKALTDSERKPL